MDGGGSDKLQNRYTNIHRLDIYKNIAFTSILGWWYMPRNYSCVLVFLTYVILTYYNRLYQIGKQTTKHVFLNNKSGISIS